MFSSQALTSVQQRERMTSHAKSFQDERGLHRALSETNHTFGGQPSALLRCREPSGISSPSPATAMIRKEPCSSRPDPRLAAFDEEWGGRRLRDGLRSAAEGFW